MKFKLDKRVNFTGFLEKPIKFRYFKINKYFINKELFIYNGKKFFKLTPKLCQLNSFCGEYSFTRKLGKIHSS